MLCPLWSAVPQTPLCHALSSSSPSATETRPLCSEDVFMLTPLCLLTGALMLTGKLTRHHLKLRNVSARLTGVAWGRKQFLQNRLILNNWFGWLIIEISSYVNYVQLNQANTNSLFLSFFLFLSSSPFSTCLCLPVHSHYLYGHMLAAFWEWYAKSGERDLGARGGRPHCWSLFVAQPHLAPFTSHPSLGHVQYRGQLWPLNSWERSLAALAALKETRPGLSHFTPVLPVALLLWCCAPAPLVSAVGSCPSSYSLNVAKSKPILLCYHVLGNTLVG